MATTALGLSEKQKAMRTTGLGASEIAAVAGIHPTRRPIDVWLEKTGQAEPFEGNEFTEWGHRIERVVGEAWAERHPDVQIFTPGTLRHRTCEVAFASPDRVVVPRGRRAREVWQRLLEIKNVSTFQAGAFGAAEDDIPEHMLCQVQWQLEVTDLEEAELVPLIGGHDFRSYPIHRDREMGGMLIEVAERFWTDHVEKGVPPPVDGTASYDAFLRKRFPKEAGPVLPATPEAQELVTLLRGVRGAKKTAEAEERRVAQLVKDALGDALGFEGLCTWKANKPGQETNWESVARALANDSGLSSESLQVVVAQFTTTKPGARVLRLAKE